MARLFNFILLFIWMDVSLTKRVKDSPRLSDFSKIKQSYIAWPANTPLSLKCKAHGAKPLTILWYKDSKLVKPSSNVFEDQKWNLKFRKPQLSDNGVYTCVISNAYGMTKHNYSLRILQRVQSAPVLVPGYPKPVTARVGDNVELECLEHPNVQVSDYRWLKTDSLVQSDPKAAYEKANVDMISPQKYKSFTLDDEDTKLDGVKLELKHVTEEDEGYYTCFLSNNNGFTHGTTFLNVTPILATDPPEFLVPKHDRRHFMVSVEDEEVAFSCPVRGGAPLKYQWFYNGQALQSNEKHEIHESELIVRYTRPADDGAYTCKIRNAYGQVKHSFELQVLPKEPLYPDHPVLLPSYPKNKTALIGDSTSLYCADTSDRLVDYRWLKWNSSVKSFTKADLLNAATFTILSAKYYEQPAFDKRGVFLKLKNLTKADEGLYTCLASTYLGYSYRSAFLTVQYPVKKQLDPQISMALLTEKATPKVQITAKEESTQKPVARRHCLSYEEDFSNDKAGEDTGRQCETTAACASLLDETTGEQKMFCDESELCSKHNLTSGDCTEVNFKMVLCCCTGEFCNQPSVKLFQKTKHTASSSSSRSITPVIFFASFVLTISLMLALLGYRLRQRKAALKERIVHETRPSSRKMTRQKVMETRWLKEDI